MEGDMYGKKREKEGRGREKSCEEKGSNGGKVRNYEKRERKNKQQGKRG